MKTLIFVINILCFITLVLFMVGISIQILTNTMIGWAAGTIFNEIFEYFNE